MNNEEMNDLENPENWDFEKAERHPPVKGPRVIVSVAFPRDAYEQVARSAQQRGMRVSEFIREASLEKAAHSTEHATLTSLSGPFTGAVIINGRVSPNSVPAITRAPGHAWVSQSPWPDETR